MVSIKHIVAVAALGAFSIPALAGFNYFWRIDDARYRQGDCITPTDQSLSFYGHYARVEGVVSFDGTTEPGAYVLSFPIFVPRTPLYPQNEFCVRQNVK
jgi:hypothetical protein